LSLARTMAHGGIASQPSASRSEAPPEAVGVHISMDVKSTLPPKTEKPGEAKRTLEKPSTDTATTEQPTEEKLTEEKPGEEVNAAAEVALTRIYRVGAGDVLDIRINDSTSPQSTLFTVTPLGFIEHPMLAEPLHAGGLTV